MSDFAKPLAELAQKQQAIPAKRVNPSDTFVEFKMDDVEQSIPSRFEQIVRKYPERIAIKTANQGLTYGELNTMANRVAQAIGAQQGKARKPVALLFDKGAPLASAMLGVLKAGKFFVLLDPALPAARLAAVLDDSQAGSLLANQQNVSLARKVAGKGCRVTEFESLDRSVSDYDPPVPVSPEAFAYLVYTSGSTGQPKGVMQNHRHLLHSMMLRTNIFRISEHDRLSLLASGTASALMNTFNALLNGATLFPFEVQKEGVTRLASWLLQEKISICLISAPLFRSLCEALSGNETFPHLRVIRLTSEAVYRTDVDLYRKHFSPGCILINGLSSSETGPLRKYLIDHETEIDGSEMPLGYALEGKEILLLDDAGKQLGFNEVGEIVVRSRYLASGYWRRPKLTEAKFKNDPEGGDGRLYFTGDLGLMLSDNCLIYKGRKDLRVKIRGYGVEIAEVEKALLDHESVREAVVVSRQNEFGDARLIAYFTAAIQPSTSVSELQGFLKKSLPDYMIPSAFVMLDKLPLAAGGKIDRQALPELAKSRPCLATSYAPPRTSVEEELVKIWAEVLSLDEVGIHDNFFELGGHSLTATRVVSRAIKALQLDLPIQSLFQAPTVAAMAALITQNSVDKPGGGHPLTKLEHATMERKVFPTSFSQQRLWFLDQLEPNSWAYNICHGLRLHGPLNVEALERSLNEIVRRHESLRTNFSMVEGEPVQIISSFGVSLSVVEIRDGSEAEHEEEIRRLATAEARRPFDLTRGPVIRATLVRVGDEDHVLLVIMHHIAADGWSMAIFFRELSALYEAFAAGNPSPLPPLPAQYADYAVWQRKRLQGPVLQDQLSYWTKQLNRVATLQLPSDRPRRPVQSYRGAKQSLVLSKDLAEGLKTLSRKQGVTLFMTLLAAFQTLLYRYTGQEDIAVGSPIAGRTRIDFEGLIGFFVNTLVLRGDLSGRPTFRELLARLREVALTAYDHQDVPFEKLVEELQPERNVSHSPLFQVAFALQNVPTRTCALPGLAVSPIEIENATAKFDLYLAILDQPQGFTARMEYNTDLFDARTIKRMMNHFHCLLQGVLANPEQRLSDLPLLTEIERRQLLVEWQDTARNYPGDKCVHQLFEKQAERTPDKVAVIFEKQQLTYRDLDTKANQLAHYLRKQGVGPEVFVGICMERSVEVIIALLGVLKAGGTYVPLDPAYPHERLAYMLADTQAPVLLTQKKLLTGLPDVTAVPGLENPKSKTCTELSRSIQNRTVVCLDSDWAVITLEEQDQLANTTTADNLAYVIYTSGSTGKPKGVSVTHRGVTRLVKETNYARLDETEVLLQFAPLSFDAATFEIWACLLNGAKLVVFPPHTPSLEEFADALKQARVTTLWLTSALFQALVENHLQSLAGLKQLLAGGDVLSPSHVRKFINELPGCRLINGYGPTENTTFTCCYPMRSAEQFGDSVSIGRPIANTQVYILDRHLNPLPIGISGELYAGGDGLARGYFNNPELTAEKFIPNPFSTEPGVRLYKTGDLARYRTDGNLEFLGRIDNQVKIRGFRIELGEIESVLYQHEGVRETVVIAREDTPGEKRLVAYVAPTCEWAPGTAELRIFLEQKLPDYMIPALFVFLDVLPLTPVGKVDRRALPAPDLSRPELDEPFVAPRNPLEEILAAIWAEVLRLEKIGVRDNFFDLGGHSLLATQVIARVREAFQMEIPLRAMFEKPTIEELAKTIAAQEAKELPVEELLSLLPELESLSEEERQSIEERTNQETRTPATEEQDGATGKVAATRKIEIRQNTKAQTNGSK